MRSFLAALRTLVLPYNATSGARIILDGVKGTIKSVGASGSALVIDPSLANAPVLQFMSPDGLKFAYINSPLENGARGQIPNVGINTASFASSVFGKDIYTRLILASSGPSVFQYADAAQTAVGGEVAITETSARIAVRDTAGTPYTRVALFNDGTINVFGRVMKESETWNNVTLANTWTTRGISGTDTFAPMSYKMDAHGRVFLRGSIAGGTVSSTAGVIINSVPIPAQYRPPTNRHDGPITSADLTGASPGSPRMSIDVNGNFTIFGTGPGPLSFGGYSWDTVA